MCDVSHAFGKASGLQANSLKSNIYLARFDDFQMSIIIIIDYIGLQLGVCLLDTWEFPYTGTTSK